MKIEAEGLELILANEFGDHAIIPKKDRNKIQNLIKIDCNTCIDKYVSTLPLMDDYAEDGTIIPPDKVSTSIKYHNTGGDDPNNSYLLKKINTEPYSSDNTSILNLIKRTVFNKDMPIDRIYDEDNDFNMGREALSLAMGYKTKQKYIQDSKYKPSIANSDTKYKAINKDYLDTQAIIDRYFDGEVFSKDSYRINPNNAKLRIYGKLKYKDNKYNTEDPIEFHIESKGKDEQGNYISYYDKYNLRNPIAEGVLGIGKDNKYIEYYDRIYYEDVPIEKKEAVNLYGNRIAYLSEKIESLANSYGEDSDVLKRFNSLLDYNKTMLNNKLKRIVRQSKTNNNE